MKKAVAAKAKLRTQLRSGGVQAACGISKVGERLVVKVNLTNSADRKVLPRSVDGIRVVHAQVGAVKAMTR